MGCILQNLVRSFLFLVLIYSIATTAADDYCSICKDHTMCLYSGVASKCFSGANDGGVSSADQAAVIDMHNSLRNKIASGKEDRGNPGPQPSATNMLRLEWDSELATIAQRWADQCNYKHDACRNVERFYVGQNIATTSSSSCSDLLPQWDRAINNWYGEVESMNKAQVPSFDGSGGVGHYTQVVWATTSRVGCGYRVFQEGKKCRKLYVCNYGKGGNMRRDPVYEEGAARSQCSSSGGADSKYPALC